MSKKKAYVPQVGDRVEVISIVKNSVWYENTPNNEPRGGSGILTEVASGPYPTSPQYKYVHFDRLTMANGNEMFNIAIFGARIRKVKANG